MSEVSLDDFMGWLEEQEPFNELRPEDKGNWITLNSLEYWRQRYIGEHHELDYVVPEHTSQSFKIEAGQVWKIGNENRGLEKPGIHIENVFNAKSRGQWVSLMSTDKGWVLLLTTEPMCENHDVLRDRVHGESDQV